MHRVTVTWDVAGTNVAPIAAENVKISLSADGGLTYPHVLAASTPNDGSEVVPVANVATAKARLKVEAVGNVFFDVSTTPTSSIQGVADVTNDAPAAGAVVQYSDALSPTVTVSATDPDTAGSGLTAVASGLPTGMTLAVGTTSAGATLPGTRTWTVVGTTTAAPGTYPVTVTVTDDANHVSTTTFTIVVTQEDATPSYTGDELVFPAGGASSANVSLNAVVRDSSVVPASGDSAPGDIRKATVTFKEGAATLCGPIAVALLGPEETTGTAGCTASLAAGSHTIDVLVDGWYVGSVSQVVQVLAPAAGHVGGNGDLVLSKAAGSLGPAAGTLHYKLDANFKVEKNTANNRPNGSVDVTFSAGGKDYLIRSFDLDSIGVVLRNPNGSSCPSNRPQSCIGLGDVRATATLFDVTKKQVKLLSGLRLHVTATDGLAESDDAIGITLWDGNQLLFSSNWSGGDTAEQRLSAGTIKVDLG